MFLIWCHELKKQSSDFFWDEGCGVDVTDVVVVFFTIPHLLTLTQIHTSCYLLVISLYTDSQKITPVFFVLSYLLFLYPCFLWVFLQSSFLGENSEVHPPGTTDMCEWFSSAICPPPQSSHFNLIRPPVRTQLF